MELAVPVNPHLYSRDEYFRLAAKSRTKLEFKAGQIIDMGGATSLHN